MRSRAPVSSPEASDRREPSLARTDAVQPAQARLLPQGARGALRAALAPRFELHAGERSVVASSEPERAKGELGKLLKKLGLAALALLALVGAASLLRPFVGL